MVHDFTEIDQVGMHLLKRLMLMIGMQKEMHELTVNGSRQKKGKLSTLMQFFYLKFCYSNLALQHV